MYLLLVGVLLSVLKLLEVQPVAQWSWWWVLLPFPLTAIWWWVADATGYTQRKANERMEQRQRDRREADRKRLRLPPGKGR